MEIDLVHIKRLHNDILNKKLKSRKIKNTDSSIQMLRRDARLSKYMFSSLRGEIFL